MTFALSQKSLDKLVGVDPRLVKVVKRAIQLSNVDFGVIEGVRSQQTQMELFRKGVTQTIASKHLVGRAVDLMAYINGRPSWELMLYDDIADAMREAARECDQPIRWGGAWHVDDIREFKGPMQDANTQYVQRQRVAGKRPFIDGPHFEMA